MEILLIVGALFLVGMVIWLIYKDHKKSRLQWLQWEEDRKVMRAKERLSLDEELSAWLYELNLPVFEDLDRHKEATLQLRRLISRAARIG